MNIYEYQRSRSFIDLGPRSLRFNIFKLLFLETARPIEARFHVEPPWDGRTKECSNGLGHMTNMAAMLIYGKNLKNLLLCNQKTDYLETCYAAWGTRVLSSLFK